MMKILHLRIRWANAAAAALAVLLCHCGDRNEISQHAAGKNLDPDYAGSIRESPLSSRELSSQKLFQQLDPDQIGINMVHPIDTRHRLKRLYESGYAVGGIALGDIDADGLLDVFFASGPRANKLYRQVATLDGQVRFEDITADAGVAGGRAWSSGASMVDIDGDGDLDIHVTNYDEPNHLFVNDGTGRFTEGAKAAGLAITDASLFPAFADYDNDGDLDCYLLTHQYYMEFGMPKSLPASPLDGVMTLFPEYDRYFRLIQVGPTKYGLKGYGRPDYLFRNDGNGKFTDVTSEAGIFGDGLGLSVTWCDFDQDGWIDIYVANDSDGPDRMYRNQGDGTFRDVAAELLPHTTWFSMGSDAGDLNNDSLMDFMVLDMSSTTHYMQKTTMGAMNAKRILAVAGPPPQLMRNTIFLNTGNGPFREAAFLTGMASTDWSWATKLGDFDCDGRLDVFISNGVARNFTNSDNKAPKDGIFEKTYWDFFEDEPPHPQQNLAFRNAGNLKFVNVSKEWGLDDFGMSYSAAQGDLDNDGDLDLIVANLEEPVAVYRNQSEGGNRVVIRLEGRGANTFGLGATVAIETNSGRQIRQLSPMTGFLSSNDPRVHFGLGEDLTIERLEVTWPGGQVQAFEDLAANRLYTICQPGANVFEKPQLAKPTSKMRYQPSEAVEAVKHRENEFDDFSLQPLLPNKLSQLGPALSVGDMDGDGKEDLFIGGAAGSAGQLFLMRNGKFVPAQRQALDDDRAAEDMGSVMMDVDGDGDLDLYVVSGGYEFEAGAELLRDRLYLNDGEGNLQRLRGESLPDLRDSGSCAVACDFDRDGDLDLFVGSRVIPGRYPLSPSSRLLRNDSSAQGVRFTDVTDALAPGLRETGLVTSALWSDTDNDGWLDLLVTHEWGPVKIFRNVEGALKDQTSSSGISDYTGWWNGITGRDIDGDGDIDYVATNFGLNTKYHASQKKPAYIYYGKVTEDEEWRLIEAEHEGKKVFPIRGKSCSTLAMPHLGKKFKTYHEFALAELSEIYSPDFLGKANRYEATTLESGVFINIGGGKFRFEPLPRIAQIAPSFGICLTEIDGDGHADLYLVQNFFTPQVETGQMDGGLSQALLGRGDAQFDPLPPAASGLILTGDAKSLAVGDLNGDRWPDFVAGVNNSPARSFQNLGDQENGIIEIRLKGRAGNPTAVGSKVTLVLGNGHRQTAEVYAGNGYLTQSSPRLSFGVPAGQLVERLEVRWPDGSSFHHEPETSMDSITIEQTAAPDSKVNGPD